MGPHLIGEFMSKEKDKQIIDSYVSEINKREAGYAKTRRRVFYWAFLSAFVLTLILTALDRYGLISASWSAILIPFWVLGTITIVAQGFSWWVWNWPWYILAWGATAVLYFWGPGPWYWTLSPVIAIHLIGAGIVVYNYGFFGDREPSKNEKPVPNNKGAG